MASRRAGCKRLKQRVRGRQAPAAPHDPAMARKMSDFGQDCASLTHDRAVELPAKPCRLSGVIDGEGSRGSEQELR